MNMFTRAAHGLMLTPAERALLKLVKGFIVSAALAGLTAAGPYVVTGTPDYKHALWVFVVAMVTSLYQALEKWLTAESVTSEPETVPAPLANSVTGLTQTQLSVMPTSDASGTISAT